MRKKKKNQAPIPILVERETRYAVDYYECNSESEDGEKKRKDLHWQEYIVMRVVISSAQKKEGTRGSHFFLSMRKRQIVRDAIDHECNTLTVKASMVKKKNFLPLARIMNNSRV